MSTSKYEGREKRTATLAPILVVIVIRDRNDAGRQYPVPASARFTALQRSGQKGTRVPYSLFYQVILFTEPHT